MKRLQVLVSAIVLHHLLYLSLMPIPDSDYTGLGSTREDIKKVLHRIAYSAGFRFRLGMRGNDSFKMPCQGRTETGQPCPHDVHFKRRDDSWELYNKPKAHDHDPDHKLERSMDIPIEERLAAVRHGPEFSWDRVVLYFAGKGKTIVKTIEATLSDLSQAQSHNCF